MKRPADGLALLPLLMVAASGLSQSRNIHENVDPYNGLKTLFLEVSTRSCPDDPPLREHDPVVHILFMASQNSGGTVSYFITPELDHGSTLSVRSKGTMDTLIDGAVMTFSTVAGSVVVTNYDAGRSYIHETVPFVVSQADLARLSSANSFQFRVNGPRQAVQRCTDAKRLHDLSEFLGVAAQYGTPASLAPLNASQQPREETATPGPVKKYSVAGIDTYACPGDPALGPHDPTVQLTIEAEQHPDHTVKYFIVTDLSHGSPLNLRGKGTLDIEINGVSQSFHNPHAATIDTGSEPDGHSFVHESIAFHVDRRDIVALNKSSAFQFRIHGSDQTVQRCTDARHLQEVNKFISSTATLYDHPVPDVRNP